MLQTYRFGLLPTDAMLSPREAGPFERFYRGSLRMYQSLAGTAVLGFALMAGACSANQSTQSDEAARPDFSGYYQSDLSAEGSAVAPPSLKGEYAELYQQRKAAFLSGNPYAPPEAACRWKGMPSSMVAIEPLEILQLPDEILIVLQDTSEFRRIYTDGRAHPADIEFTYAGHSIGQWEGDVLVVDTVAIKGGTWLEIAGAPHSDSLHIVERIRLTGPEQLEDVMTLHDDKAFLQPWTQTHFYTAMPKGFEWTETVCTDNNRNQPDSEGRQAINPPQSKVKE